MPRRPRVRGKLQLVDASDQQVRDLANEILSRREYAGAMSDAFDHMWTKWLREVLDWLGRFGDFRISDPALYWSTVAVLMIILIVAIFLITRNISEVLRAAEPAAQSKPAVAVLDLRAEAESLAASGEYIEAAHRLMIASFRTMAEHSVIELRPDRSNFWIRGALRRSKLDGTLSAEIDGLIERTERRWFGARESDPEIYFRWRAAFERLSTAVSV